MLRLSLSLFITCQGEIVRRHLSTVQNTEHVISGREGIITSYHFMAFLLRGMNEKQQAKQVFLSKTSLLVLKTLKL